MLTFYCPNCWHMTREKEDTCSNCGFQLKVTSEGEYEAKLIASLHHPVPERRNIAAQVLGNLATPRAIPALVEIVNSGESDYYFMKAVLTAIAKIDWPDREKILETAGNHSSALIAHLAQELLDLVRMGERPQEWS